jgi:integrase
LATAKKLPSGNYRVRVFVGKANGKAQYKSFTAATKKQAEYDATNYLVNQKKKKRPEEFTVGEAIDKYISSKDSVLSPSTIRVYKKYRRLYLQTIMDIKLSDIEQEEIQNAVNEDSKSHSPKTIRNAHGLLTAALVEYAPEFKARTKMPQKIKMEIQIPDDDNIKALMQEVSGTQFELAIILGALVGLRRSEMCALNVEDIDTVNNKIKINKALVMGSAEKESKIKWYEKTTKTYASTRTLNIDPSIITRIIELSPKQGRVITFSPNTITKGFIRFRNKLGFKFRLHDLRHYNASVMLALGIPDKYAMQQMGHATPNMLKNVYQHIMKDKEREVSDALGKYFSSIICHEK